MAKKPAIKWPLKTLVEVDWIDSSSRSGWGTKADYDHSSTTPLACRSAGYVFKDMKDTLSLVMNMAESDQLDLMMTIPKLAITKIRRLK